MSIQRYTPWPGKSSRGIYVSRFCGHGPVLPHKHDFVELVVIGRGACSHSYNGSDVPLIQGDVFVVVPHEQHSYGISKETVIYNCLFYPEALNHEWRSLKEIAGIFDFIMVEPYYRPEVGTQEILHLNPTEYVYIERLLNHMIHEQESDIAGTDLVLKADLVLLLVFLGRIWDNQFAEQVWVMEGKRSLLKEAISYIETHIDEELRVSDLAARTYLSPNHFRQKFKEYTGLSPLEYINRIRITKAMDYLDNSSCTISEIAERVGIGDANYFARLFKRIVGCSPSDYRDRAEYLD